MVSLSKLILCDSKCCSFSLSSKRFIQIYFTLIFSLKESLYKAVYPCAKNYIDFLQAELISIDMLQHTACFKFSPEIMQSYPLLQHYHTHWDQRPDHFVTYCVPA